MKISVFALFLRVTIIAIIMFSVYGLMIQFIFSYLNQSRNAPEFTILNFAGPLLMTILILLFAGLRILSKSASVNKTSYNSLAITILTILSLLLIGWQGWYILTLLKIKADSDLHGKLTELMPMTVGLFATLFFMAKTIKQRFAR